MSRESFLRRANHTQGAAYHRSKAQEKDLARRGSCNLVPRSGAGVEKGDIKGYNGVWRIEAKTTTKKSFSITQKMLDQIEEAALAHGELPAIVIEFVDEHGKPIREVCVVPSYTLDTVGK